MIKLVKTDEGKYTIFYTYSTGAECRDALMNKMFDLAKGTEHRDFWWRCTDNKTEDEICKNLISKNHRDGFSEDGMSVSEGVSYQYFHGYKYIYPVTGEVVGSGSDGEPILRNVTALTKPAKNPSKRYLKKEDKLNQLSEELMTLYRHHLRGENITSQCAEYSGSNILMEIS